MAFADLSKIVKVIAHNLYFWFPIKFMVEMVLSH